MPKITHGLTGTRLYKIRDAMIGRCKYRSVDRKGNYIDKGITVCKEWTENPDSFFEWALSNGYKDDLTIDRIDNEKGYSPDNCRWTTMIEQQNNKSTNVNLTIEGKTNTISEWSRLSGVPYETIRTRIRKGFIGVDLISEDIHPRGTTGKTIKKKIGLITDCLEANHYERAKCNGIKRTTLESRIKRGWNLEKAITEPPRHKAKNGG